MPSSPSVDLAYPLMFWLVAAVLLGLAAEACHRIRRAWSIPALLVYGTIAAWYAGDMVQMGPTDFQNAFGTSLTTMALGQVILFLMGYRLCVQWLLPQRDASQVTVSAAARFRPQIIDRLFVVLLGAWAVLFVIGLSVTDWNIAGVVWPPSSPGDKVGMFARKGIGTGADFLLATGGYVYLLFCSFFGMMFVLMRKPMGWWALLMVILTWPYFLFDRARNIMLALVLPTVFCYLVATWGGWWKKAGVTLLAFISIYFWFGQVMHYRDSEGGAYKVSSMLELQHEQTQQLGLNMLEELCYMDSFMAAGTYQPNWGARYLAEVVSIVPRTIWPGKPLIGYDYSYVRGFRDDTQEGDAVWATIATGLIGQGIANFGRFFGVLAAALLMAWWTRILAKLWLRRFELPRFLLFLFGCGLTFNLGRDITLLVLWPFVFAYVLVRLLERFQLRSAFAARRLVLGQRPRKAGVAGLPNPL